MDTVVARFAAGSAADVDVRSSVLSVINGVVFLLPHISAVVSILSVNGSKLAWAWSSSY